MSGLRRSSELSVVYGGVISPGSMPFDDGGSEVGGGGGGGGGDGGGGSPTPAGGGSPTWNCVHSNSFLSFSRANIQPDASQVPGRVHSKLISLSSN